MMPIGRPFTVADRYQFGQNEKKQIRKPSKDKSAPRLFCNLEIKFHEERRGKLSLATRLAATLSAHGES